MSTPSRFYIITGKGGVGKTSVALALVNSLKDQNKKAKLLNFKSATISKKSGSPRNEISSESVTLDLQACAMEYVSRKMKSETIAKWVVKTPFFRALINMLPGFSFLIYLGKAMELLIDDPQLILVLDSPSSGHALTMLESTQNYKEIFSSGALFEDTNKVINQLYKKDFTKTFIVSIPTMMALNEALDLQRDIQNIHPMETSIICNSLISKINDLNSENLADVLKRKLQLEKEVLDNFKDNIDASIPYITEIEDAAFQNELKTILGEQL